jgi:hypothetical protein
MIRYNKWMSYSYNGVEYGLKDKPDSIFTLNFNSSPVSNITYKEALYRNASIMRDTFNEPFDVCLSGGIDSEVVVRVFKDLGIKHNTFIFKFENNHNIIDVENAIRLCNNLNISYNVIDFELEKFFANEAYYYAEKSMCAKAGRLPRMKWIEALDNIPIFGDGEPYWIRGNGSNFDNKSEWFFHLSEDGYAGSLYSKQLGRTVLSEWYEYTPEVLTSYYMLPYVKTLIEDKVGGKQSTWSSRAKIHHDIWPDIVYVPKLVGYEGADKRPGEYPNFMIDFQQTHLSKYSNSDFRMSEQEFKCLIAGHR